LLVGVLTTWVPVFTSVGIHLLPLGLGGMSVARNGLPRHAALVAFSGYALLLVLSFVLSPPALNINLVHTVWPPIAHLFSHRATYHIAFLAAVLAVLAVGEWTIRKLVPTQTAASNQLDTNSIDDVPSM
jgi:hypothetical protein